MPPGAWRRRPPLPPTPRTVVVQPIGEATPEEIAAYAAGREEQDAEDDAVCSCFPLRCVEWSCGVCASRPDGPCPGGPPFGG